MSADECGKKRLLDSDGRPCAVHTDQITHYNAAVRGMMATQGFGTVDAWPVTVARPDLSYDGLHFQAASCMAARAKDCTTNTNAVYRTLNDMFLSAACPDMAAADDDGA